jgi:hypothetical protein
MSGHDGEWLAVRAGALGRAIVLRMDAVAHGLTEAIEAELDREARSFDRLWARGSSAPLEGLRAATVLAHNAGDLSRVVEAWPDRPELGEARAHFVRLGHEGRDRFGGAFVRAGVLNKAIMAIENHRFLALRKPRVLRRARAFLLPIGPFFDAWGADVGRALNGPGAALIAPDDEHALPSAVEALLETHLQGPAQQGCLRALAGVNGAVAGGLDGMAALLPARLRKVVRAGAVRDALRLSPEHFEARMAHRAETLMRPILHRP